jgi:outer membrane protease
MQVNHFRSYYGDFLVNLNYELTDDLNLKANVGFNMQDNSFRVTSQGGTNLDIPGFTT